MNLKDILVHIDTRPTCDSRLQVAIQLALSQDAKLTGIYVIPHPYYASHHIDLQQQAEQARQQFEQVTAAAGVAETEWICVDCGECCLEMPFAINLHAHYHDLLIISQTDFDSPDRATPHNLPEQAVLGSGRPVLIIPYAGEFSRVDRRIMLAWRGGPESSRALHDAMPLLRRAEHVQLMTIHGPNGDDRHMLHQADISRHMRRYNLSVASEKPISGDLSIGDTLLNRCADEGIDLLVIGIFSEYRRGHQTLGEVGRYLLEYMTIPVLMSH